MLNSGRPRTRVRLICAWLASWLALAGVTQLLWAQAEQAYTEVPIRDARLLSVDQATGAKAVDEKRVKQLQQIKNNILMGSLSFAENKDNFDLWYKEYQFRIFSQLDQMHKLADRRKDVVDDLRRARSKEARDTVLSYAMQYMRVYATNYNGKLNFHPAVRYNAMLLIGELNQDEIVPPQRFPNPLPSALPFLVQEFKKPDQPEYLKLAALIGILRHVQLDWGRVEANRIPAATKNEIGKLMLALVQAQEPPPGGSPEGHLWMRRRGLEVLASMGAVGIDAVNTAITSIIHDPNADMKLRLTAASTLAHLTVPKQANRQPNLDLAHESLQLGALLVQACQGELKRIEDFLKRGQNTMLDPSYSGMMGMGDMSMMGVADAGMPGMGGMPGDASMMPGMDMGGMGYGGTKDPQLDLYRRRIKYEILCIEQGLAGLKRIAPPKSPQEAAVVRIEKEIEPVKKATDPPPMAQTLIAFHKGIKDSLFKLEGLTASVMPKPAAEPAAPKSKSSPAPSTPSDEPNLPANLTASAKGAKSKSKAAAAPALMPGAKKPTGGLMPGSK